MGKIKFTILLLVIISLPSIAQQSAGLKSNKPKLMIGLVIDQMRWDYLKRYENLYSGGGFKRLMHEGFSCNNTLIPYIPTYTAPGHTCIYTGSVPAFHGIVGNDWYEKGINKNMYCTSDTTVVGVGTTSQWGKMSPRNLWATTITDELRLSSNFRSKVIGISLKDRASILPAGHSANAAYWYDETIGSFVTSSYYMDQLPDWVSLFNKKDHAGAYMKKKWDLFLPLNKYIQSTSDNETIEAPNIAGTNERFPYQLNEVVKKYEGFRYTPYANTYLLNFAKAAIENERLGMGKETDFLTISMSATDLIGHRYGPNSLETEDTYLRLDADISNFLNYLDHIIGKGNYTLFLTADHGVSNVPAFLSKHHIPSGKFNMTTVLKELNTSIESKFQLKNEISMIENSQVYLSTQNELTLSMRVEVKNFIIDRLLKYNYIMNAFSLSDVASLSIAEPLKQTIINGYNPKRSGDIEFIPKPFNIDFNSEKFGTTHGSWNMYDAHIPLIFFGAFIKKGKSDHTYFMTDIAATVASILRIQIPDACVGKVIEEVIKKN